MFEKRVKGHHRARIAAPIMASNEEIENFLEKEPCGKAGIIYFHVPYCDNICSFCNLNRVKKDGELDGYVNFLVKSIEKYAKYPYIKNKVFKSIYFGGGTPTIFNVSQLEKILSAIRLNFSLDDDIEFSFETTLHNLSLNKIKLMQDFGVNRYSIGIQTFSDSGRKLLNRVGTKAKALKKLEMIRESFKGQICSDIIYNYPKQTIDEAIEDAKIVKSLKLSSSSFYSLQFHKGSEFIKHHDINYYDLEKDKELHHAFLETILAGGDYKVLEYTKVALDDRYLYITLSHRGVDILPIGAGAGGRLGSYSIFNVKPDMRVASINTIALKKHALFSSLFQYEFIKLDEIKKLVDENTFYKLMEFFKECEDYSYLKIEDDMLEFSIDGIFWGNTIAEKVIDISKEYFLKEHNLELKEIK
ncbi:MAG: radical SAM protein [Campylobacteraceae bacterium]|nr:radical SAM protein [Campylobacteraceae bacterium]